MNLSELLQYIDTNSDYGLLEGDAEQTLTKAREDTHRDALAGRIIKAIAEHCNIADTSTGFERADAVNALGPLRLEYMKDDAPVDGFRMLERIIHLIDGAFNDEALRLKDR
ncbi:MAG: hypothetical protein WCC36_14350 [Gammaproteobacteria bacterium]